MSTRRETRDIDPYTRGGQVVAGHTKTVHVSDKESDRAELTKLSNGIRQMVGPEDRIYPDPALYAQSKVSWWEEKKRRRWRTTEEGTDGFEVSVTQRNLIDPDTGKGEILYRISEGGGRGWAQPIRPVTALRGIQAADLRRANLGGATLTSHVSSCDLRGANLDGISVDPEMRHIFFSNTDMTAASCVGALFERINFLGGISFRGANLLGASFKNVSFGGNAGAVVDFRDSNITADQLNDATSSLDPGANNVTVLYPSLTFQEASEKLGINEDELAVLVWAGDIEVRDQQGRVVTDGFDTTQHRICIW